MCHYYIICEIDCDNPVLNDLFSFFMDNGI